MRYLAQGHVALVREANEPVGVGGGAERLLRGRRRRHAGDVRLEVPAALAPPLAGPAVVDDDDVPKLDAIFVGDFDQEASPNGAKGLGELTSVSVVPAIANAIQDAIGVRITSLPITPEKLFRAIRAAQNEPLED